MHNEGDGNVELEERLPLPTTPQALFKILQVLDISYKFYEHRAVFTVAESSAIDAEIPGIHCRNLFLRDKKKNNFLVVAAHETKIDLKGLSDDLGCGRLSFGSKARLWEYLGIRPGSVCPFTVINDIENKVQIVLDAAVMRGDIINCHPLDNTMTIGLSSKDLLKFLSYTGHEPIILDFSAHLRTDEDS